MTSGNRAKSYVVFVRRFGRKSTEQLQLVNCDFRPRTLKKNQGGTIVLWVSLRILESILESTL